MRGRERVVVVALLLGAAALSGALAGFVAGALAAVAGAGPLPWVGAAVVAAVAVVLDLLHVAPPSVRRQVPQLWGRVFPPPTVAVLYGARLGVGPLTILRTWLWWAALAVGASAGPWWSAGVGAVFGAGRVLVMLAAGTRAAAQQRHERWVAPALAAAVLAAVAGGWVVTAADTPVPAGAGRAAAETGSSSAPAPATTPPAAGAASTSSPSVSLAPVPDQGLADALPADVLAGFERVADDPARRLGPLDLAAASTAEGDVPAERSVLETRHFVGGQARAWRAAGGRVAYASVYEFASAADALAYLADGLTTIEARGARLYDVDPPPAAARGFSQVGQAAAGAGSTVSHGTVFVRGERFYLVFVSGRDSSVGPADAAAVAAAVDRVAAG